MPCATDYQTDEVDVDIIEPDVEFLHSLPTVKPTELAKAMDGFEKATNFNEPISLDFAREVRHKYKKSKYVTILWIWWITACCWHSWEAVDDIYHMYPSCVLIYQNQRILKNCEFLKANLVIICKRGVYQIRVSQQRFPSPSFSGWIISISEMAPLWSNQDSYPLVIWLPLHFLLSLFSWS